MLPYATEDFVKSQSIVSKSELDGLGVTGKTSGQRGPRGPVVGFTGCHKREAIPATWRPGRPSAWVPGLWSSGPSNTLKEWGQEGSLSLHLWCSCVLNEPALQLLSYLASELMMKLKYAPKPLFFSLYDALEDICLLSALNQGGKTLSIKDCILKF